MVLLMSNMVFFCMSHVVDVRPSSLSPHAWEVMNVDIIQNGVNFPSAFDSGNGSYPSSRRLTPLVGVYGRSLLFLMGGVGGFSGSSSVALSDTWLYHCDALKWEYVDSDGNGATKIGYIVGKVINGIYSYPGSRVGHAALSRIPEMVYLFGGFGFTTVSGSSGGFLADFWLFNVSSKTWVFAPKERVLSAYVNEEQEEAGKGPR